MSSRSPSISCGLSAAGGLIGRLVAAGLQDDFPVKGIDLAPGPFTSEVVDLTDAAAAAAAVGRVGSVVDLAADSDDAASWETVYRNNRRATLNVFEAARLGGARRIVFASSCHVVGMYEQDEPFASIVAGRYDRLDPAAVPRLTEDTPIRPDGPYAVGKAFGEAAGRLYRERHGISVICLRIGSVQDRPTNARHFATLLSHRDLVALVRAAVTAPESVGHAVLYGVSGNTWRMWALDRAAELIGYVPADDAERWR